MRGRVASGAVLAAAVLAGLAGPGCSRQPSGPTEASGLAMPADATASTEGRDADGYTWAKEVFVEQGNQVCREEVDALIATEVAPPETVEDAVRIIELVVEAHVRIGDRLAALTPPPGDEAIVADLVGRVRAFVDQTRQLVGAVRADDWRNGRQVVADLGKADDAIRRELSAYGLSDCGG